jgi:hypothetical protein
MAGKLAEKGWLVRVETMDAASKPVVMNFAVGKNSAREALTAVLNHPAIETGDQVISNDQLTATEISSYRLRPDEVRTYGKRPQKH